MNTVVATSQIPEKSIISKNFRKIHYCDSYSTLISTGETVDAITTKIFSLPPAIKKLFTLRNFIAKRLGLKTGDNTATSAPFYPVGSRAVLFPVTDRNDLEIVMAEDDKHLNFRTSVMIESIDGLTQVCLTTIVHFNNTLGRLYSGPVKPFHKAMIKSRLKNLKNEN